ncbi:hypothetical protein C7212DRAFT_341353 [Tuber magnatum]|uniref:Uncharacterized protein n=1 Tax=Tuber magnatum TaxID=42249 RepID=A0A317T4G1_9PEZI|nr:hypothetical protein C7212DRAFT_341353 [Tuber magnatum]
MALSQATLPLGLSMMNLSIGPSVAELVGVSCLLSAYVQGRAEMKIMWNNTDIIYNEENEDHEDGKEEYQEPEWSSLIALIQFRILSQISPSAQLISLCSSLMIPDCWRKDGLAPLHRISRYMTQV